MKGSFISQNATGIKKEARGRKRKILIVESRRHVVILSPGLKLEKMKQEEKVGSA